MNDKNLRMNPLKKFQLLAPLMSQTESRVDETEDEKNEECKGGRRAREVRQRRRRQLALGILDDNLAITAEARVLEDAVGHQDRRNTALRVLDVDGAVAADDVLRAREDTEWAQSAGQPAGSQISMLTR